MQKLRIQAARKAFGALVAVEDVSFEVNPGEMITLLGPSGCGKTTTLRLIAGLEQGDSGEIYLGDRLLSDPKRKRFVPPEQRSMGLRRFPKNYA
jgi:iron(III) transport system ATP-binding protein